MQGGGQGGVTKPLPYPYPLYENPSQKKNGACGQPFPAILLEPCGNVESSSGNVAETYTFPGQKSVAPAGHNIPGIPGIPPISARRNVWPAHSVYHSAFVSAQSEFNQHHARAQQTQYRTLCPPCPLFLLKRCNPMRSASQVLRRAQAQRLCSQVTRFYSEKQL
jgi:hypothetical protein